MSKRLLVLLSAFVLSSFANAQTPFRMSDKELSELLGRVEVKTDAFEDALKDAVKKSPIKGTAQEDAIEVVLKDFEVATDRLKEEFNDENAAVAQVQKVLDSSRQINSFMNRHPLTPQAQGRWAELRSELNQLASAYNVSWCFGGLTPARRFSEAELNALLKQIEWKTDRFEDALNAWLDDSRFSGTQTEDDVHDLLKQLEVAADRLEARFDDEETAANQVEQVLSARQQLDFYLHSIHPSGAVRDQWLNLNSDLTQLAQAYGLDCTLPQALLASR